MTMHDLTREDWDCLDGPRGLCDHRLVDVKEIVVGDRTVGEVLVCEDCAAQLDPDRDDGES